MVIIISASLNPGKTEATQEAVDEIFPEKVAVVPIGVESGISSMPLSKDECRIGARNRARRALDHFLSTPESQSELCISVGNEGGVVEIHGSWYLFGATFATDGVRESWGGETLVLLPPLMIHMLEGGTVELGTVIDQITGERETKKRGGAIAELTGGRILRKELFKYPVKQALVPWISRYF